MSRMINTGYSSRGVTLAIVGAGPRGTSYARLAAEADTPAIVVAVAEPRADRRTQLAEAHDVPATARFEDWRELADQPQIADVAVVATQDAMHTEPTLALLERGYHVLLEKPMAPTEAECQRISDAAMASDQLFAVCHVLRYTPFTCAIKKLIDTGAIGELLSIQRLEPVGYWHQAHAYVRGAWRNEATASSMLLAKSCHDLDWISYLMDAPCRSIHSFGQLSHFRPAHKPAAAEGATRCFDCACERECPYSAKRIYLDAVRRGNTGWPVNVLTHKPTVQSVTRALHSGPYGRCVYECDNDVVDHQVVNMQFAQGQTASFTMTAFTTHRGRHTRLFGTHGEINGDDRYIDITDFLTERTRRIDTQSPDAGIVGGHGGGDRGMIEAFLKAVTCGDVNHIRSGAEQTLASHRMVFAAERSRREGCVVNLDHNPSPDNAVRLKQIGLTAGP